jgi:predicted ATP-binding protein involved in virulence
LPQSSRLLLSLQLRRLWLKAKKIHLECQKLATQIDILRAKYVSLEDVLTQFRAVIYAVKEKMRRLPSELAYEVSGVTPAESEERIEKAINKILTALSEEDYNKVEERLKTQSAKFEDLEEDTRDKDQPKRGRPKK